MTRELAIRGGALIIPAREAALLHRALNLDAFRRHHRGEDRGVDEVLYAWRTVDVEFRETLDRDRTACRQPTSDSDNPRQVETPSEQDTTTTLAAAEAADLIGVTKAAVTEAARTGRLPGSKSATGRWVFNRHDITDYITKRETK